jgi:AmmeMemoRadiSam system protein B
MERSEMSDASPNYPRLRPVEAFPAEHEGEQMVLIQDSSGLADGPLVVSPAGFFILTHFDGQHTLDDIQAAFQSQFNQELARDQLETMIEQLDVAHYLDTERFARFYQGLVDAYRAAPTRVSREAAAYGAEKDGLGPTIDRMLGGCTINPRPKPSPRLVGLVAPHLDYPRGGPCYAAAYRVMADAGPLHRVIILGTNHFGRGLSVVATGKDFETPLGTTRTDRDFLAALEARCGAALCRHEFDHLREHSVELQVLVLQQLLGPANFQIVPVLCPDPCGPTGTAPADGDGVDLRRFAGALGELVREDARRTLVVAGADLSHFGRRFGDDCDLDEDFTGEVERKDREALGALVSGACDSFVSCVRARENDTRICSAGSIFALAAAFPGARPELLKYHQAVDRETGTGVSCSAIAFWQDA